MTRIRFYVRDTDSAVPIFQDEELLFLIAETGDYKAATIAALNGKIAELANTPNFTAAWLTVSVTAQIAAFQALLNRKMAEWSIGQGALQAGTISPAIDYPDFSSFDEFFSDPLLWSGM